MMTADNSCKHVPAFWKKRHIKGINVFLKPSTFWSNSMKNLFKVARLLSLKTGFSLFLMQGWEGGHSIILSVLCLWAVLHLRCQSCICIFLGTFLLNYDKPSCVLPLLCSVLRRRRKRKHLRAWQGLRNRWLSLGLPSHLVPRMDSFLGKNPSFCTEGGCCLWTPASFVTEAGRCVDITGLAWV